LRDAQKFGPARKPKATFPSGLPFLRLDHVFLSHTFDVTRAETLRTQEARIASDHLPLFVDFVIRPAIVRAAS
jgi:endonuclease/exonuclease/phosphatase family metal-dependent hydrolase